MSSFKTCVRSGHWPTLLASFLYVDFCFAAWGRDGALGLIASTRLSGPHRLG